MKDSVYFCTFTEEQITNVSIEDIRNIVIKSNMRIKTPAER